MSNKTDIGFVATRRQVQQDGAGSISIKMLRSTCAPLSRNELPVILNTLKRSHLLDQSVRNVGFDTYVFDFPLAPGVGFPYVFDDMLVME